MSRYGWKYKGGGPFRQIAQLNYVLISFNGTRNSRQSWQSVIYMLCKLGMLARLMSFSRVGVVYTKLELKWGAVILTSFLSATEIFVLRPGGREKRFEHYFKNLIEMTIWSMPLLAPCAEEERWTRDSTHILTTSRTQSVCVYIVWLY